MVRRGLKIVMIGSTVLIAVLVLVLGFAAWQLSQGPVRLAWLAPYIERALNPEDGSLVIAVGGTELRLSEVGYDLDLVGTDVRGQMPDGKTLFDLPEIKLGLSVRALLRRGLFAVSDLELQKPQLHLLRSAEGALGSGPDMPDASFLKTLLDAASASSDPDQPLFYLTTARVLNGAVIIEDIEIDQTRTVRNVDLDLRRQTDGFDLGLNFAIAQAEQPALGSLRGRFDNATGWLDATLSLKDLLPASAAGLLSAKTLEGLDLSVSLEAAGRVHVDGSIAGIDVAVVTDPGTLTMPDRWAHALSIEAFALRGSLAPDLDGLTIDGLDARINGSGLTARGTLSWRNGLDLAADLEATQITRQNLDRFWPLGLAEKTRDWALSNINECILPHAKAKLRLQPGDMDQKALPDDAISGTFTFEDLDVSYHEPLPPLVGAAGEASFTTQSMVFDLREGRIGGLTVESATVDITGIGRPGREPAQLSVDTTIDGPFREALALIRQTPVNLDELGSDLNKATGQVQARLKLGLPLHDDVSLDEIRLDVQAQLRDLGIKGLRNDLDLTDGQLQLAATRESLEITGTGTVGSLPLSISWHERFDNSAAVRRRYKLSGEVTSDALRQVQLELPISLAGTAPLEAEVEEDQDGLQRVRLSVNLEPADLSAPLVDWQKPAGEAGRLEAEWQVADSGIVVDRFDLIGGDLDLRANARLKTEPLRLDSLDVAQLRLGATDSKMTLNAQAGDSFEAVVDAKRLDLDRLLAENSEAKDGAGKPPRLPTSLKIKAQVDQLKWQDAWFKTVRGQLARSPEGWQSAAITSELPGGGTLSIDLAPGESGLDLNIRTDDAGDLSSLLLEDERFTGGKLNLVASIGQQQPDLEADGKLIVQDFTLINAPVLARLLTLASIQGIGDLLGREGISFDHLEVPFMLSDGVLSLENARMVGSQIGLSCSGQINLEQDHLDLNGTVIPVYTLNRTIGQIPLIGDILAGSNSEGAFSVAYAIRGSRSEPELTVNPLSVLAPGLLRDLFGGITSRTPDAPTNGD